MNMETPFHVIAKELAVPLLTKRKMTNAPFELTVPMLNELLKAAEDVVLLALPELTKETDIFQ